MIYMTYTITSVTYAESNKKQGGVGRIERRDIKTIAQARKVARQIVNNDKNLYKCEIYDDGSASYVTFEPTGQRLKSTLGDKTGEVIKHWVYPNRKGYEIFYYPDYGYKSNRNMKFRKYIVKADGELGQGYY